MTDMQRGPISATALDHCAAAHVETGNSAERCGGRSRAGTSASTSQEAIAILPNDTSTWPLRMTKRETAIACRISARTLERRVKAEDMPGPDEDGFFVKAEIVKFLDGGVRQYDKARVAREARGGLRRAS